MAKLNIAGIISGLNDLVKVVEQIAPVAQSLGGPIVANAATLAIAGMAIAQNVLERAEGVKDALSSQDETKLRQMLSNLQQANDRLAGVIAEDAVETASDGADKGESGGS